MRRLLLLVLALLSFPAFALLDTTPSYWVNGNGTQYPDAQAACIGAATPQNNRTFTSLTYGINQAPRRTADCKGTTPGVTTPTSYASVNEFCPATYDANFTTGRCEKTVATCPAGEYNPGDGVCAPAPTCSGGQSWNGSSCQCPSGTVLVDGTCKVPCTAGQTLMAGYFDMGESPIGWPAQMSVCSGSCTYNYDGTVLSNTALVNGVKHYFGKGKYTSTGGSCGANTSPQPSPGTPEMPPDTCPPGFDKGSVNGKTICTPKSTTPPASAPRNSNGDPVNPYGVGPTQGPTTTTSPPVTNPDGSTTQTTTTTNPDGSVTQTTTTTNPNGSTTTQTKTTPGNTNSGGSGTGGTGNGGTGTGGKGLGGDEGACDADPNSDLCNPTAGITDLYTKKTTTLAGVLDGRKAQFMASPIGTAAGGFFVVPSGGSCPVWTLSVAYFSRSYSLDWLCNSMASMVLAAMKACILLVASFMAFRIAVE